VAFKITGRDLRGFKPELAIPPAVAIVQPDASGGYTLAPDTADLHGGLREETQGGQPNLGFWDRATDYASWRIKFQKPGRFKIVATCATVHADPVVVVELAGRKLETTVPATGAWDKFAEVQAGVVEIPQAGEQTLIIRPRDEKSWKAINLRSIRLVEAGN